MRAFKAVLLLNAALVLGAGAGALFWEERTAGLERARGRPGTGGERLWQVRGVVRAVLPEINVIVITHDDIPGWMPAMTMGFRAASPAIHDAVRPGDAVRFTLKGRPPDVVVVAIERTD